MSLIRSTMGHMRKKVEAEAPCFNGIESVHGSYDAEV